MVSVGSEVSNTMIVNKRRKILVFLTAVLFQEVVHSVRFECVTLFELL